jgi:type VII secretion protein EccB
VQTRRDQVQAYRFAIRRLVAALLHADAEAAEQPMRRLTRSACAGIMVAALAVAAVGVYGLLRPGGDRSWRDGTALIVEKETRTRYVYLDGVLHPVLNYASARLILSRTGFATRDVSAASLRGAPHGLPVGIPGAPESLPGQGDLVRGPWAACSVPGRDATGTPRPVVRLAVGAAVPGQPVGADRGVLLRGPDGMVYLVWRGRRLRVAMPQVLPALGYAAVTPVPVGAGWLDVVPQGPDLRPLPLAGIGTPDDILAGQDGRVGQVYVVGNIGTLPQYYVLAQDGLAPVTPTQAALLLGEPTIVAAYAGSEVRAIPLVPAVVAAAPHSALVTAAPDYPLQPPRPVDIDPAGTSVCARYAPDSGPGVTLTVGAADPVPASGTPPVDPTGGAVADRVAVPAGRAAVVRAEPAPGVGTGTIYLVDDVGVRYPLSSTAVLDPLGYGGVAPVPVPAGLLGLLRTGPRLDPHDAAMAVPVGAAR